MHYHVIRGNVALRAQAPPCADGQEQRQDETTQRKAQLHHIRRGGGRQQLLVREGLDVGRGPIDGAMQEDG
jgi:hypothetical protein